ncbi:hypothetical protein AAFF_G00159470 [Aldrovandia affinis]|uniref:Heterochromatin protein 1-binding protein 3 n=1 Tax=Aldrovandia affinis TaxID=143900 RepID=A0AAD7RNG3_9TELE|nr:hypothetical protein AAFF_G00159470 [Aldrovandia affinis]
MPIRRAAGTPPQETPPKAAGTPPQETPPKSTPDGDPEASSEESVCAGEEQEAAAPAAPAQGGEESVAKEAEPGESAEKPQEKDPEGQGEKKGDKDAGKEKVKKVKRTIPSWATISASRRALAQKSSVSLYNQPKMDDILIEAIQACKEKASTYAIRKYIMKNYASLELDRRTFLLKKALKRLLEKRAIKQLKGKGFSGSFTICKQSQKPTGKKPAAAVQSKTETLGDTLPLIITRLCEPKEASYILIKKYLEQHFPQLNVEQRPDLLKSALQRAVEKGHLEQITGKGASGTFQLKRAGDKPLKGGLIEDAILTAITAMNEPKTCSITILRKFLLEKHKDSRVSLLVNNLKRTLKTCKMRGWMEQISGNGFNGTYQLCYPFYPSPAILFPEKQKQKENEKPKRRKERKEESSEEEESEEEDEEEEESEEESESEDEPPTKRRKQQKRPTSKVRRPPSAKKRWPGSQVRSKGGAQRAKEPARLPAKGKKVAPAKKQSAPAKRPAASAKKPAAPPKRAAPQARRPAPPPAKKPASAAKASSSRKAPPPKKAAPAAKPKTTGTKKMTSRAPKRLAPKRSPSKTVAPKSAVKAKPAARKSQRSRK